MKEKENGQHIQRYNQTEWRKNGEMNMQRKKIEQKDRKQIDKRKRKNILKRKVWKNWPSKIRSKK